MVLQNSGTVSVNLGSQWVCLFCTCKQVKNGYIFIVHQVFNGCKNLNHHLKNALSNRLILEIVIMLKGPFTTVPILIYNIIISCIYI